MPGVRTEQAMSYGEEAGTLRLARSIERVRYNGSSSVTALRLPNDGPKKGRSG